MNSQPDTRLSVLAELRSRHESVLDAARPDAVAKQRKRGALTARERIALLLDSESRFYEWGALAEPNDPDLAGPADAVVVGWGTVHGVRSVVISFDYTVLGGSIGPNTLAKLTRSMALAEQYDAPVFILSEGGGARAHELSSNRSIRTAGVFAALARWSGKRPMIGVALGRAFAGHAILVGMCDVVIATESSSIGVAGPPLVKASTGQVLTPEQIGDVRFHEAAGTVERVAVDDRAAIAEARTYASFFFQTSLPYVEEREDVAEILREAAFSPPGRDMRRIVAALTDVGSLFELRPAWASEVMTTLARIDGRAVGLIATDPGIRGGLLTADGCDKIARFMALCNAFGVPLVVLMDSVGVEDETGNAMFRHAARLPVALSKLQSPPVTVLTGKVGGITQALLGGFGTILEGGAHLMWPTARVTGLGLAPEGVDGTPLALAAGFVTDDVIDPGDTRDLLIALLPPAVSEPVYSGFIDPW